MGTAREVGVVISSTVAQALSFRCERHTGYYDVSELFRGDLLTACLRGQYTESSFFELLAGGADEVKTHSPAGVAAGEGETMFRVRFHQRQEIYLVRKGGIQSHSSGRLSKKLHQQFSQAG